MTATIIGDLLNWLTTYWDELLVFFALLGGATLGVGVAVWFVTRGRLAKINKDTAAVLELFASALAKSQTAVETSNNTLAKSLDRETELTRKVITLENDVDAVRDDLRRTIADNRTVIDQLTAQIVSLKQRAKQQDEEITELRRGSERKDAQLEQLRTQVQSLRQQLTQRDEKIAEMALALDCSDRDKRELLEELRRLEGRLNGKADKVTDSTEVVVAGQETPQSGESGEHVPSSDGKEESVDKSAEAGEQKDP